MSQPPAPRDERLARADAVLADLLAGAAPAEAAQLLAILINRAVTRLHTLARTEAAAAKDTPAWPSWAQLQNASRSLILQASTCRELAQRLLPSSRQT